MLNEKQKLDALVNLGVDLNQVQDLDILMQRILTEARHFVGADAGSIYICDDQSLHFTYTQNDTLQSGHFDPELVEIFMSCLNILRSIQKRYRESEI